MRVLAFFVGAALHFARRFVGTKFCPISLSIFSPAHSPLEALRPFLPALCLFLLFLVGFQFILIAGINRRFSAQTRMLRQFFSGPDGEDLEELLRRNLEESREALANSQMALARSQEISLKQSAAIQHFALLRYDAFDDVMGQQSFSLALLDGRDNGVVISSVLGRSNSRCYGKMIVNGQPEQPLTEEEKRTLLLAIEKKISPSKNIESSGENGAPWLQTGTIQSERITLPESDSHAKIPVA